MSQNGEAAGKSRTAHRIDGEWRQHVFLPGGNPVCCAEGVTTEEVPADDKLVACGACLWAIAALKSMAVTMFNELELPSLTPTRALKSLDGTDFTDWTIPMETLAAWGRERLWFSLIR